MSYKKLKKENMTVSLGQNKDGELMIVIGMCEHENWLCCFRILLKDFPEECKSMDDFKNLTISGVKES